MPSKPPVKPENMFAACSSSAMVHSVSMSSVRPCVRRTTQPLTRPTAPATSAAATKPDSGSVQPQCAASMPTV